MDERLKFVARFVRVASRNFLTICLTKILTVSSASAVRFIGLASLFFGSATRSAGVRSSDLTSVLGMMITRPHSRHLG